MDDLTAEHDQEQHEQAYGQGHEDGRNADFWDELGHTVGDLVDTVNPLTDSKHDSYDRGFHRGLRDR
jgi:hypothetical protein